MPTSQGCRGALDVGHEGHDGEADHGPVECAGGSAPGVLEGTHSRAEEEGRQERLGHVEAGPVLDDLGQRRWL